MSFDQNDADLWYLRNKDKFLDIDTDPIMRMISQLRITPERVIEFGCADGYRLNWIREAFDSVCLGSDLSSRAINEGLRKYPDISLSNEYIHHAYLINFRSDLVIFGFCLYLVDPANYSQIVWITDQVLQDGGHIIIWDYFSSGYRRRQYQHNRNVWETHMNFSSLFTWHPYYKVVAMNKNAPEGPVIAIKKEIV